jgi:hypothetical protein
MKKSLFILLAFALISCNNTSNLWPGGEIPFIMVGLSPTETKMAEDAIVDWMVKTYLLAGHQVINFRLAKKSDKKFLTIAHVDSDGIPESYTPKLRLLSVSYQCNERWMKHSIGHSLGLMHEHQKLDRDLYISIKLNDTETLAELLQFFQIKSDDYDMTSYPYDYNSIMHYRQEDVTRIGTIEKKGDPNFQLGNDDLSILDVQKVVDMYEKEKKEAPLKLK